MDERTQQDRTEEMLHVRRKSLFWRIHFWAALIASPFALIATLTGIFYVFTPQIEAVLYRHLDRVEPAAQVRPLDELVAAARAAMPADWQVHSVVPAYAADSSSRVNFVPSDKPTVSSHDHGGGGAQAGGRPRPSFGLPANAVVAYVNPYTAEVLGTLGYEERFTMWARRLHSRMMQGDAWRWMIELATSWMMVMLVTGIWLWWPRGQANGLPEANTAGRKFWQQWHAFVGVAMALMSVIILSTGLTWSKYSGAQIRVIRDSVGQAPPQAPSGLKSEHVAGGAPMNWQQAYEAVRGFAPDVAVQLNPPRGPHGTWRASSASRDQPSKRFDLQLDAFSGEKLYFSDWSEQTAFGKATAIGIPFHRGEFGWWNQLLLLAFGIAVMFSLVSGWVMFIKRRRPGAPVFPPLVKGAWRSASPLAIGVALLLIGLMPMLLWTVPAVILCEVISSWARRRQLSI